MVKLLIDIPKESYDQLNELSETYKADINELVQDVISVLGNHVNGITQLSDQYIAPYKLTTLLYHILDAGIFSSFLIFYKILEALEAKGRFIAQDYEIDLDDFRLWINYFNLVGSDFLIDGFDITLQTHSVILTANSSFEKNEVSEQMVDRLKQIIDEMEDLEIELPDELVESEFEFTVLDDDVITVQLDIYEENFSYLPTIPVIDSLFQTIYQLAGIKSI